MPRTTQAFQVAAIIKCFVINVLSLFYDRFIVKDDIGSESL